MSIPLSTLVGRLRVDVPPRDGVPSDAQYERCVKDAVTDFGQKAGRSKIGSISIVSGTAAYTLPTDFVRLIQMDSLSSDGRVINRGGGLIPMSSGFSETWTISNGQLTFYPTPAYTMVRYFEYQAGWALDGSDNYTDMSEVEAGVLLHLARSQALTAQANIAAREAWSYQMGEARVSKERLAAELREQAKQARADYDAALMSYNSRSVGMRATYSLDEYS
jgi:hypothetical protein